MNFFKFLSPSLVSPILVPSQPKESPEFAQSLAIGAELTRFPSTPSVTIRDYPDLSRADLGAPSVDGKTRWAGASLWRIQRNFREREPDSKQRRKLLELMS